MNSVTNNHLSANQVYFSGTARASSTLRARVSSDTVKFMGKQSSHQPKFPSTIVKTGQDGVQYREAMVGGKPWRFLEGPEGQHYVNPVLISKDEHGQPVIWLRIKPDVARGGQVTASLPGDWVSNGNSLPDDIEGMKPSNINDLGEFTASVGITSARPHLVTVNLPDGTNPGNDYEAIPLAVFSDNQAFGAWMKHFADRGIAVDNALGAARLLLMSQSLTAAKQFPNFAHPPEGKATFGPQPNTLEKIDGDKFTEFFTVSDGPFKGRTVIGRNTKAKTAVEVIAINPKTNILTLVVKDAPTLGGLRVIEPVAGMVDDDEVSEETKEESMISKVRHAAGRELNEETGQEVMGQPIHLHDTASMPGVVDEAKSFWAVQVANTQGKTHFDDGEKHTLHQLKINLREINTPQRALAWVNKMQRKGYVISNDVLQALAWLNAGGLNSLAPKPQRDHAWMDIFTNLLRFPQ